ncbi:leucine-rich repeat domain-containing protein [Spirosoma sp. BT702]|uniref:Leucine-rich repeat domain-containing protein n=1 Tax=Spirosoma profusum TaxID=2771354 RepID=A0A926Y0M9_9BACT|nr:leucine-rich repeat domain-containing protein [Spirosoma profusum]MBD2704464.1 leucine-rich repeat domain-containing protein [Spirosoma profusum]
MTHFSTFLFPLRAFPILSTWLMLLSHAYTTTMAHEVRFVMGADTTGPPPSAAVRSMARQAALLSIASVSPTRNQRNAVRNTNVAVTFDQPLSNTGATLGALRLFSQQRGGQLRNGAGGSASVSGNTLTFNPTLDFKPGEKVYATVTTDIQSTGSATLAQGNVFEFIAQSGGTGKSNFKPHPTTPIVYVGNTPYNAEVGDLDGDGDLDIVTANIYSNNISVRLNDGLGNFIPHSTNPEILVGLNPYNVALGDVDGDGDLDMLAPNVGDDNLSVLLNNGSGSFTPHSTNPRPSASGVYYVALGDVDGDGDLDALVSSGTSFVSVFLNNGSGSFILQPTTIPVGGGCVVLVSGDVDSDGDLDFVTTNQNSNNVSVRLNDGSGNFTAPTSNADISVGSFPRWLAKGDVDSDGDLDVLVANYNDLNAGILLNDGSGNFNPHPTNANPDVHGRPIGVNLGDVDGDGDLDLLAVDGASNLVDVLLNQPIAPVVSGFAATSSIACVGSVATFTATIGNVSGSYTYTLTNGTSTTTGSTSNTALNVSLVASGSGTQSFSLIVSANGSSTVVITNLTVGSHPDYQPLVDFYNATNGPNWTNKTRWMTSCDPCTGNGGFPWYGVTCLAGRVSQLELQNNGLSGSIPASLSALTNLQQLNLSANQLSGSIPTSLSALTNLQRLTLSGNLLSGTIPASLSALTNLKYLFLSNNQLSGSIPSTIGSLTNLQHFYLNNNQLSGSIPSTIGNLTNLQYLDLTTNQLSGSIPESMGSLINLQELRLNDNRLSGSIPSTLGSLTNVQVLNLYNNQLSGSIPSTLGSLSNLLQLYLNNNQLSGSIPSTLGNLTNPTLLVLHTNQLSGCYPASLTALCEISTMSFSNNAGLPGGGSNTALDAFCATGQGRDDFVPTATAGSSTATVGNVVSLSTAGGISYRWTAPVGAQLNSSTSSVVSVTLTTAGVKTFTVVVSQGGSCSQTAIVSVTATAVAPTVSGFAATSETVCAGSVATFTATVGNVSGSYAYTLTNGSSTTSGTSSSTIFSASLVVSGSESQSFSLVVSDDGTTVATTTLTVGSHPDLQALTDLYNSTNGAGWTNKTGWLTSCNPCGWYGVSCIGGRVVTLDLSRNALSGSIPSSLSALSNLKNLQLDYNQLRGSIPSSLGLLTNLTFINLISNELSGSIPASLGSLTNLGYLDISYNTLSGSIPASFSALSKLQTLSLDNNQLSGSIPGSLGALANLKYLGLSSNALSGSIPTSFSALSKLERLELNINQLSGNIPAGLSILSNLQTLFLSSNQLSGSIPESLSALSNLEYLYLDRNELSGSIPVNLGALTDLKLLSLHSNNLSGSIPASLGALTNLQSLYLNSNQLSGCYPASLTALCGISNKVFASNVGLPSGGSSAGFNAFCATGRGSDAFVPIATASPASTTVGNVISLSTTGGASYSWRVPSGAVFTSSASSNVVSASLTTSGVKTFTVVVSQGGSCTQTAMVSVTATAVVPTVSGFAATSGTVCVGSVATFTATIGNVSGSYAYTLTNGTSSTTGTSSNTALTLPQPASGSGSQSFTLIVSNNDQSTTATAGLWVNPLPTTSLQASGTLTCATTSVTLIAGGGSIGQPFSYSFSGAGLVSQNPISGTAVAAATGTYSVTVTTSGGCSATATTSVSSNTTTPTATILAPSSATLTCTMPSLSLTATGGGTYRWDNNSISAIRSVTASGPYSVTVTSVNGCSSTASIQISQHDTPPTLSINPVSATLTCTNPVVSLTAVGTGSYRWNTGATTSSISATSAAIYSVTLTGTNGCSSTATAQVFQDNSAPSVNINPTSATLSCANPVVSLSVIGSGTYRWNTGAVTSMISATLADTYSVTLTSTNGCTATASAQVFQNNSLPTVSITPGSATLSCNTSSVSLSAVGTGTYRWNTGDATSSISATLAGTYSVTLTGTNGCSSTASTSVTYRNCAPTLANAIPSQFANLGTAFSYVIPATTFTDAETPNSLTLSVAGLPAGLSFVSPNTISGTPSTTVGSPFTVTVVATDSGGLAASTSFSLTVQPTSFSIVKVIMLDCNHVGYYERRINFEVSYSGTNGQPISVSVVNEMNSTTIIEPYQLNLFTDNPVIVLRARQQGTPGEATFNYNWLTNCANGNPKVENPIPPQSVTVATVFSYTIPANTFTDAETANSLSLSVAGLPAGLSFVSPNLITGVPSTTVGSPFTVTVVATDASGGSVFTIFPLSVLNTGACSSMHTLKAGDWSDVSVWSCGWVPSLTDVVTLNHAVSVPVSYQAQAQRLLYSQAGQLMMGTNSRLQLGGN